MTDVVQGVWFRKNQFILFAPQNFYPTNYFLCSLFQIAANTYPKAYPTKKVKATSVIAVQRLNTLKAKGLLKKWSPNIQSRYSLANPKKTIKDQTAWTKATNVPVTNAVRD